MREKSWRWKEKTTRTIVVTFLEGFFLIPTMLLLPKVEHLISRRCLNGPKVGYTYAQNTPPFETDGWSISSRMRMSMFSRGRTAMKRSFSRSIEITGSGWCECPFKQLESLMVKTSEA